MVQKKAFISKKNIAVIEDFCSRLTVLDYTLHAATHYGEIRAQLESQGTPIGINDLHIAAHARSLALTLVTNNEREFNRVDGLRVTNWV